MKLGAGCDVDLEDMLGVVDVNRVKVSLGGFRDILTVLAGFQVSGNATVSIACS